MLRIKTLAPLSTWRVLRIASVAAIASVAGVAGYLLGHGNQATLGESIDPLVAQRVVDLERQLTDAKLGQVVDGGANESLRQSIKSLREELSAAQEEVQFYRRLMTPAEAQRGIHVEKLELTPTDNPVVVDYQLLLARFEERSGATSGMVTIDVVGMSKNGQEVLPLTDFTEVDSYPLPFRFRYFQELVGSLRVPDGFKPSELTVTVATAGKNPTRIQRTFAWMLEEE